ncbi:MAG: hypothetical protein KDA78_21850, partial [Planctomycetaceae bacterium]|nr:hypothetical protein [Planctomycetaceae bacterium]
MGVQPPEDSLLLIQGPLTLDWRNRRAGIMPRIENGDLHAGRGPDGRRFQLWLNAGVHVAGRPDWRFVKLHTHGCKDSNTGMLLGEPMQEFHASVAGWSRERPNLRYHYVTAWEMALLVRAAEQDQSIESVLRPSADVPGAPPLLLAT